MADLVNRGESERGTLEGRRGGSLLSNIWEFDPFRAFWPTSFGMSGVEIARRDDGYDIEVSMPGFRTQDVEITYQDGVVTITGRNERRSMRRSFTLPEDIDEERIDADMEHGILTLHLKQHPRQQPRKIAVGSAGRSTQSSVGITGSQTEPIGAGKKQP